MNIFVCRCHIRGQPAVRFTIQLGACTWHYAEFILLHRDKLISATHSFQTKLRMRLMEELESSLSYCYTKIQVSPVFSHQTATYGKNFQCVEQSLNLLAFK